MDIITRNKMVALLILYDGKQAKKKGYNRYVLPIMLQALDNMSEDIDNGMSLRDSIVTDISVVPNKLCYLFALRTFGVSP